MIEYTTENVHVGDVIRYATASGDRTVTVDLVEDDIKRGRPGFDGTIAAGSDAGQEVWGYMNQVVEVVTCTHATVAR